MPGYGLHAPPLASSLIVVFSVHTHRIFDEKLIGSFCQIADLVVAGLLHLNLPLPAQCAIDVLDVLLQLFTHSHLPHRIVAVSRHFFQEQGEGFDQATIGGCQLGPRFIHFYKERKDIKGDVFGAKV